MRPKGVGAKGIGARGWFYSQGFHAIRHEAEADGAVAASFLELASPAVCDDCGHAMSDHDEHGHCQDECPCRRCSEGCKSDDCANARTAKREWDAAKAHAEGCQCGPCKVRGSQC